jgi:hypothetical protein
LDSPEFKRKEGTAAMKEQAIQYLATLLSKTDGDPERQHLRMMKLRALTRLNENDTPRMLS